jgi:hypothetical protein
MDWPGPVDFALFDTKMHAMDGALDKLRECARTRTGLGTLKYDLYAAYALNLHVFLNIDERDSHPVAQKLARLKALIERVEGGGRCAPRVQKRAGPREMTEEMVKNRKRTRKSAESNPRLRNRDKAERLCERAKHVFDGNIDAEKSRSAKF